MTSSVTRVRIVIAGEHAIFRNGLRHLLEAEQFVIVGETGDCADAAALVADADPDILLLGFARSATGAIEALRQITASSPAVRAIILTDRVDAPEVMCGLQIGARGVVPKDSEPDVLFKCITSVMAGHFWVGPEQYAQAVSGLRKVEADRRRSKAFGLTKREIEILRAVVAGYTNKEIAERSSISENTVKSHLTHIFNKSGASSRVELAIFAANHRLLDGV
jgi:two-component system nitrate/nitrite response regulator NarL